jgi:autotransporter-associated beta strand protein
MKKSILLTAAVFAFSVSFLRAEFLYESYLVPGFDGQPNTEYSRWNVLFAPNGGQNFPDAAAPKGVYQTASAAGFINPGDWSPSDPLAFWHVDNPTLTQTNGGHFVIGPGTAGNIYSFFVPSFYSLADNAPYTLGTVVFQFQTEGTTVDFDSIRLRYDSGSGIKELDPDAFIREYRAGSAGPGGFGNRIALQWDVTGLGITTYEIAFHSASSSLSFQQALLDTATTHEAVVPRGGTWAGNGAQNWSNSVHWLEGSPSVPNGNVRFENATAATITLDGDRTVAELIVDSPAGIVINGSSKLTSNTGITTTRTATGTTAIGTPLELGAFNLMQIEAGTVELNGPVSGAYGVLKTGDGSLVLANDNTFGGVTAGLGVQGGTLRIEGTNSYGGSTTVLWGALEIAGDAPVSAPGALGNAGSAVVVGASSSTYSGITEPARILIDGDYTIARNINIEQGTFEKRLGAKNTATEAVYSGNITLSGTGANATGVKLFAAGSEDVVRFSGALTGGAAGATVSINVDGEEGKVIFSGADKTHASQTVVGGGTLVIDSGTSASGNGAWSVNSGATLRVDGTLGGSGALSLAGGSTLAGSGSINKAFVIGDGVVLSPGNSPGAMTTGSQTWAGGGSCLWEINDALGGAGSGWDWLGISGNLTITASHDNPFHIRITSLTLADTPGEVHNFADLADAAWTIATASAGITGFTDDKFEIDTSAFANAFTGTFGVGVSGNDLVLSYTAVPEASGGLMAGLGAAVLAALHRRRKAV